MKTPKYMKLKIDIIPDDIIERYNLNEKVDDEGYVYVKIKKGMYGLKEAAILAYDQLKTFLNAAGYYHVLGTAGLWRHQSRDTAFCLCVDNIGLKYKSNEDLEHFFTNIRKTLQVSY